MRSFNPATALRGRRALYVAAALILLLVALFFFRRLAVFLALTLAAAVAVFFIYRLRLPFDVSPVLVLSLVITREMGVVPAMVFVVAAGFAPMLVAGGSLDHTSVFFFILIALVNVAFSYVAGPFLLWAIVFAGVHRVLGALGSLAFGGNPAREVAAATVTFALDIAYLVSFSGILLGLFG